MNRKDKIFIVLACLGSTLTFFLGYVFRDLEIDHSMQEVDKNIYIDITPLKNSIKIEHAPSNVFFRVGDTLMQSGSIDLQ